MRRDLADIATFFRRLQWAALVVGVLWLLGKLSTVLAPFAAAAFLGWLGDPLVDRMQARGMRRNTAVIVVFTVLMAVLLLLLLGLLPALQSQLGMFIDNLPRYRDWFLQSVVPWGERLTGRDLSPWLDADNVIAWIRTHWQQAGGMMQNVVGMVSKSGFAVLAWIVNLVLIPILAFFFLRDWDRFTDGLRTLVPRDHLATVDHLAHDSSEMLMGFMRGQLLVMVVLAVLYAVGLSLLGLDLAILIGLVGGVLTFIPYLGPTFILVAGSLAALSQYGDWQHLVGAIIVWGVGQVVESYWLTPKLVGDRIGLHPLAVIFAVMAGGALFGFFGMLIALPAAAVINVLVRHLRERYLACKFYVGNVPPGPALVLPDDVRPSDAVPLPPASES